MMPTSHPPSLTPSFIHSFSGQLHAQEDASGMARVPSRLSAQSLLLMLQEGGPFNPPQMQAHPKGQGIYAPREICREWRLETGARGYGFAHLPSPPFSRGTVSGVFCTEVPIQPSSYGCHHASMAHIYICFSFFSVSLYPHPLPLTSSFLASLPKSTSCTQILVSGSAFRGNQTEDSMKVLLMRVILMVRLTFYLFF